MTWPTYWALIFIVFAHDFVGHVGIDATAKRGIVVKIEFEVRSEVHDNSPECGFAGWATVSGLETQKPH